MPVFEGISDEQSRELNKCADRTLRVESQWFNMWKIIFPHQSPPLSPFLGSYLNEMAPMLRDLWKLEGSDILDSVLSHKQTDVSKTLANEIIEAVFNRLVEGSGNPQVLTN
ncbi:hypothetical protein N0V93_004032 [Gnomoniopsis smithogilvyi]|uniref:Uncharacterized protein n=1 Tax=Gnomoniopsis smithogilvyi TaxID=1191159 RepID=A0A9W9D0F1_9PEZI|nr:hypothetical protein N0V93_004032 [Gnomoniopsis smithogilvyi]